MTTPMSGAGESVHRLVDMVVEEVSLVDHAANKHRFLIVKRDEAMEDTTRKLDDGTVLSTALTALESLTELVELLGSLGADQADARLTELAQDLRSVAEQLLGRAVGGDEESEEVEASVKAEKSVEPPLPALSAPSVNESLAKLAESFRSLSETVKEQQQRLGRVEKQFGLPNSAAPAERVLKAPVEDVGWPLDLNKPMDRESVDKALSFHDL